MEESPLKKYKFHPVAAIFPLDSDGPEFQTFVEDIGRHGVRNPIVLHEGKILDGRRRYRACEKSKVEPKFLAWDGKGSAVEYVIAANALRRHLTEGQLAVVALKSLPHYKQAAKDRQRLSRGRGKKVAQDCATSKGKAAEWVAKKVGVSTRTVEMAKKVQDVRPKLIVEIEAGRMTVSEAYSTVVGPQTNAGTPKSEEAGSYAPSAQKRTGQTRRTVSSAGSLRRNDYNTPAYALDILLPYLPKKKVIWEAAWGAGRLARHLRNAGYQVVGDAKLDCRHQTPAGWDMIVTNPPFDIKDKLLERAYAFGKPFAILLPLTALEGKARHRLYRAHGISVIIPDKYIDFESDRLRDDHCPFSTAWFCWKLKLPAQLNFVKATW